MHWLAWALLGFRFQETAMLGRGIAAEVNSAGIAASLSPLPRGSAGSSVHGIELSVLAQWAFIRLFGVVPPLHTYPSDTPSGWVIAATASHSSRTDTPTNGKRLVTPEEQYVQCMDAAYSAADKETCLEMMRKAEGLLRGEFGAHSTNDGPRERALAS